MATPATTVSAIPLTIRGTREAASPARPHGPPSTRPAAPSAAPSAAADAVAPTTCAATDRAHLPRRPPWTTGVMVCAIDRPQGPNNVETPATTDAATTTAKRDG